MSLSVSGSSQQYDLRQLLRANSANANGVTDQSSTRFSGSSSASGTSATSTTDTSNGVTLSAALTALLAQMNAGAADGGDMSGQSDYGPPAGGFGRQQRVVLERLQPSIDAAKRSEPTQFGPAGGQRLVVVVVDSASSELSQLTTDLSTFLSDWLRRRRRPRLRARRKFRSAGRSGPPPDRRRAFQPAAARPPRAAPAFCRRCRTI